jgi:hypothetical protein
MPVTVRYTNAYVALVSCVEQSRSHYASAAGEDTVTATIGYGVLGDDHSRC